MKKEAKPLKKGKKVSAVKPLSRTIEAVKPLMTVRS